MEFDNDRSRLAGGFDAGVIVDGTVTFDPERGRLVLVDEDGIGFDPQEALAHLQGERVRMTIVSFSAMETMERMLSRSQSSTRDSM